MFDFSLGFKIIRNMGEQKDLQEFKNVKIIRNMGEQKDLQEFKNVFTQLFN